MVADEQRVFHGTGGDLKGLHQERDDEQSSNQDRCQRGEKFDSRFALFFFFLLCFLDQLCLSS